MSGPIVRSGPSPEFTKNWEAAFGKKPAGKAAKAGKKGGKAAAKPATKAAAKPAKKAAPKKKKRAKK